MGNDQSTGKKRIQTTIVSKRLRYDGIVIKCKPNLHQSADDCCFILLFY